MKLNKIILEWRYVENIITYILWGNTNQNLRIKQRVVYVYLEETRALKDWTHCFGILLPGTLIQISRKGWPCLHSLFFHTNDSIFSYQVPSSIYMPFTPLCQTFLCSFNSFLILSKSRSEFLDYLISKVLYSFLLPLPNHIYLSLCVQNIYFGI